MIQTPHGAGGHRFCSLWQRWAAIVVTVAFVLLTSVAYAIDCDGLTSADFPRDREQARNLQQAAYAAYYSESGSLVSARPPPLDDGIIGPGTVKELKRFCTDIGMTASDDLPERLIDAMLKFREILSDNPDWKSTLTNEDFVGWSSTLRDGTYGEFFNYSCGDTLIPGGAFLLAEYASKTRSVATMASPALKGRFVLEEADIEKLRNWGNLEGILGIEQTSVEDLRAEIVDKLGHDGERIDVLVDPLVNDAACTTKSRLNDQAAAKLKLAGLPQKLLADVAALQEITFESRAALVEQINKIVDNLATDYLSTIADVEALLAKPTVELRPRLREAGLPTALVEKLSPDSPWQTKYFVDNFADKYRTHINDNIESIHVYTITDYTLTHPTIQAMTEPIPASVLDGLAPLQGIRFPDGDLFRTAVRLSAGLARDNTSPMNTIMWVARKPKGAASQKPLELAPIQWRGGDCGCGVSESLEQQYPSYLYGIYPFWQAPQAGNESQENQPQTIDFSILHRIGYYGVTFDEAGKIVQPLHFQQKQQSQDGWFWQRQNYSEFIERAHQYRTKVDLIVYNSDWENWLPKKIAADPLERNAGPVPGGAAQQLVESIAALLNERIDKTVDKIKPLISLGLSPARTIGDGVSLDFNFAALDAEDQQYLFDKLLGKTFFEALQKRLQEYDGSRKKGVSYFTNIIVPGECMTGDPSLASRCRYYSLDNLQKIEPHVNLFLVDMNSRRQDSDVLDEMRKVREHIEAGDTERHIAILRKLVPLVSPRLNEAELTGIELRVEYADWYFAGLATWQLDSDKKIKEALRAIFIGAPEENIFRQVETTVCNITCPQRWRLRAFGFLILGVSVVYALASYWFFSLRALYARRSFTVGVVLIMALLIITLYCDPYWSQRKSVILFFVLVGSVAVWATYKRIKDRRRDYP